MKVKTSITLSKELISQIDDLTAGEKNRSAFIETALTAYIELLHRAKRDQSDLAILNRLAPRLNREMREFLRYQVEI